jgi:hypothetical protein
MNEWMNEWMRDLLMENCIYETEIIMMFIEGGSWIGGCFIKRLRAYRRVAVISLFFDHQISFSIVTSHHIHLIIAR